MNCKKFSYVKLDTAIIIFKIRCRHKWFQSTWPDLFWHLGSTSLVFVVGSLSRKFLKSTWPNHKLYSLKYYIVTWYNLKQSYHNKLYKLFNYLNSRCIVFVPEQILGCNHCVNSHTIVSQYRDNWIIMIFKHIFLECVYYFYNENIFSSLPVNNYNWN